MNSHTKVKLEDAYRQRALAEGFPGLSELAHDTFSGTVRARPDDTARVHAVMQSLSRLIGTHGEKKIAVVGCGPHPAVAKILRSMGHSVVAIEPVASFVQTAREELGCEAVLQGAAESLPVANETQDVVFLESVLEHVDSVRSTLIEAYRVLRPGGVLYVITTNRYRIYLTGFNGEYNVPYYNWFPRLVKESYVFRHLHLDPSLANYTERPAVHWFSYADLCSFGRDAGFAQFYSLTDLMRLEDPAVAKSFFRRMVLSLVQNNALARTLALTQAGHVIFMLKRRAP